MAQPGVTWEVDVRNGEVVLTIKAHPADTERKAWAFPVRMGWAETLQLVRALLGAVGKAR